MLAYCPRDGEHVPGLPDAEARALDIPALVFRSGESDAHHTRATSEALADLLPQARLVEPPWGDREWIERQGAREEGLFARWPLLAPQLLEWQADVLWAGRLGRSARSLPEGRTVLPRWPPLLQMSSPRRPPCRTRRSPTQLDRAFRHKAAAEGTIVVLLGEVGRRQSYRDEGAISAEPWAVERFGVSMPTARALTRRGREGLGHAAPGRIALRRGPVLGQGAGRGRRGHARDRPPTL